MADFHGIHIIEDNARGSAAANGGVASPIASHRFVTVPDVNNRPIFVTSKASDGSRVRVIATKEN